MVVDAYVIALEHARQFGPLIGLSVDVDRRVVGTQNALPDRRELIVAVEKKGFHASFLAPFTGRGSR
jgi:hypothetical protein